MKRIKWAACLLAVMGCVMFISGCGGENQTPAPSNTAGAQSGPTASPTLAPDDRISISGTMQFQKQGDAFIASSQTSLPEGALVTYTLMDEQGNDVATAEATVDADGKSEASFAVADVRALMEGSSSDDVYAQLTFVPSDESQPQAVRDQFGDKGSRLLGDNVDLQDGTGLYYVRMESGLVNINEG